MALRPATSNMYLTSVCASCLQTLLSILTFETDVFDTTTTAATATATAKAIATTTTYKVLTTFANTTTATTATTAEPS